MEKFTTLFGLKLSLQFFFQPLNNFHSAYRERMQLLGQLNLQNTLWQDKEVIRNLKKCTQTLEEPRGKTDEPTLPRYKKRPK